MNSENFQKLVFKEFLKLFEPLVSSSYDFENTLTLFRAMGSDIKTIL